MSLLALLLHGIRQAYAANPDGVDVAGNLAQMRAASLARNAPGGTASASAGTAKAPPVGQEDTMLKYACLVHQFFNSF